MDFRTPVLKIFLSSTPEEKEKAYNDWLAGHYDKYFALWEKKLNENSSQDYLVGDSITIADFFYLAIYYEYQIEFF